MRPSSHFWDLMADEQTPLGRRASRLLPWMMVGSLIGVACVMVAPFALLAMRQPVPDQMWQGHSLALGAAVATLGWIRDLFSKD